VLGRMAETTASDAAAAEAAGVVIVVVVVATAVVDVATVIAPTSAFIGLVVDCDCTLTAGLDDKDDEDEHVDEDELDGPTGCISDAHIGTTAGKGGSVSGMGVVDEDDNVANENDEDEDEDEEEDDEDDDGTVDGCSGRIGAVVESEVDASLTDWSSCHMRSCQARKAFISLHTLPAYWSVCLSATYISS